MNQLKSFGFLVLCLALGVGIGRGYMWWANRQPKRGFEHHDEVVLVTGVGDAPGNRGFVVSAGDLPTLPELIKTWEGMFATTVGIESGIEAKEEISKNPLADAVKLAHARGLTVLLLPPAGRDSLKNPYTRPLEVIGSEAQEAGVDFFCISWINGPPEDAYWREQSAAVRKVFRGKIILAARAELLPDMNCWDSVDVMAAMGPLPFARRLPHASDNLNLHDVRVAWDCSLSGLEYLAKSKKVKLGLLQANIPERVTHKLLLPDVAPVEPAKNPTLQALLYEGLLLETKGRAETTEFMMFNWNGPDGARGISALKGKATELWDPKKPKVAATSAEAADAGGN